MIEQGGSGVNDAGGALQGSMLRDLARNGMLPNRTFDRLQVVDALDGPGVAHLRA